MFLIREFRNSEFLPKALLDRDQGPMILELDARPGLNSQIANRSGSLKHLQLVEHSQSLFGTLEWPIAFFKQSLRDLGFVNEEVLLCPKTIMNF